MNKAKLVLSVAAFTTTTLTANSQNINGYAEVVGIVDNMLTLGTVDESADSFEDGEWIVIMQMQDDVIGNVSNTVNFGDLGSINSAGLYEVRQIQTHTEIAGVPNSISLVSIPNNTYNICNNCSVQIITFRDLGAPDYTTTFDITAKDWDGTTGGVVAFNVAGTLTLNNNISADYNGFRGAGPNAGGSAGCSGGGSYRVNTQANFADKGEGIFRRILGNQAAGMGKILNGGGGGNSHNGGGGGGGNYTSGGDAGPGWPNCNPSAGGLGGISLQGQISANRIFMGGGGGAGEGNNNLSTDGGDGGGIVLIKANEIITDACTGVTISANGENIAFAGNDGGGGGGAGGSIVFEVNTWNITGACPLNIEASGGDGGSVNSGATHGGGGGGGQGVVFYSGMQPMANASTITNNGSGGCDNNSNPCTSIAGSGGGLNGEGVQENLSGPLPIEIISFDAELVNDQVLLSWVTASEKDNDYFTIEHSLNGNQWNIITTVKGAGNSTQTINYSTIHSNPNLGLNYYRLRQTDFNGTYTLSDTRTVNFEDDQTILYPNPANDIVHVMKPNIGQYEISIYNTLGQKVSATIEAYQNLIQINTSELSTGVYVLVLIKDEQQEQIKLEIER
ncbi:T9SS type A sorting domain-containing protein [Paracrocinitomix mangrovi]|uniref:T9SS type A sorting domain-containing protein n=1 Tax=Paracrocinitomix mangrovi TaxID=2862509 RepID=UPI001C8D71EF|nr:T9SS type A sorting domain-containing protein [Paracrocinitomix mangrovi]UKN03533.1 T9SS type A sorting domain-containing protein [Paracrocinitomix mangrovi]